MNYELALELKKAGFKHPRGWFFDGETEQLANDPNEFPDLTELIEACGEEFEFLERHYMNAIDTIEWHAGGKYSIIAFTPEEAVSRLWLALNKKV